MLKTTLDLLNYTLENTMIQGNQKNLQVVIDSLTGQKGIDHIRIIDPKGVIKYSSADEEIGSNVKNINSKLDINSIASRKMIQYKDDKYLSLSRNKILYRIESYDLSWYSYFTAYICGILVHISNLHKQTIAKTYQCNAGS
jgi:hypothetical protein